MYCKRFDEFDALQCNRMPRAIGAQQIPALFEIPKTEFELFPRYPQMIQKIAQPHRRLIRLCQPFAIEDGQDFVPLAMLVSKSRGRVARQLLALILMARVSMLGVIIGAFLRIAKDLISVRDQAERRRMACFLVIRMETLRLHPIDAMDGLLIGVGADLKSLVIVDNH